MKKRLLDTKIWEDSFIENLPPLSKYLFIYFLTNHKVELTGAYEISLKFVEFQTGLTRDQIETSLEDIKSKILYVDGYIIIKNHKKYQDYSKGNANQKKAYERELSNLPLSILSILSDTQPVDDQSTTSSELDRNKKVESRNKKRKELANDQKLGKQKSFESFEADFEEFWELYPVKVGKKKAREAYRKVHKFKEEIIAGLKSYLVNYSSLVRFRDKFDQRFFIPNHKHPTTWLNGEHWGDVLIPPPGTKRAPVVDLEAKKKANQKKFEEERKEYLTKFRAKVCNEFMDAKYGIKNGTKQWSIKDSWLQINEQGIKQLFDTKYPKEAEEYRKLFETN
jgi:hypothetical protein